MSREHKIRWRESDLKELKRVVTNFNRKLARLEKKNPENAKYLPKFSKTVLDNETQEELIVFTDRLSVKQMQELIKTRKDFNREINALKRFSRRGAETIIELPDTDNNIKTTKWQNQEMKRRLVQINKKREKIRQEIESAMVVDQGKETGYTVGDIGMGNQLLHSLEPIKISFPSMDQADVKWKFRSIMRQSQTQYFTERDEALRDNYIWSLQANYYSGDIDPVIEKIQSMDIKDFIKTFTKNPGIFEWSYHDQDQYTGYVNKIREIWGIDELIV